LGHKKGREACLLAKQARIGDLIVVGQKKKEEEPLNLSGRFKGEKEGPKEWSADHGSGSQSPSLPVAGGEKKSHSLLIGGGGRADASGLGSREKQRIRRKKGEEMALLHFISLSGPGRRIQAAHGRYSARLPVRQSPATKEGGTSCGIGYVCPRRGTEVFLPGRERRNRFTMRGKSGTAGDGGQKNERHRSAILIAGEGEGKGALV